MSVSTLDEKTALIVVDLQKGIVGMAAVHPMEDIVGNSVRLAEAFRELGLPVVLVNATGVAPGRTEEGGGAPREFPADFAELVPELNVQPNDVLITKQRWGSFTGTSLHQDLQDRGVTQVVVTGVATQAGVESTARSAHELGYHVVLVTDAMTSRDADTHNHTVQRIFPRLGETGTTDEVLELLAKTR